METIRDSSTEKHGLLHMLRHSVSSQGEVSLCHATRNCFSSSNEGIASKQADTARPQLTLRRPVVLRSRHESANFTLNQNLSSSCVGTRFLCSDAGSAKNLFNNHPDMGVSTPVSAFFISRNTSLPQVSA